MLTLQKMAITGGLSCGKSTVCRILKELGAFVISADEIVHQLLSSNTDVAQEVVKLLGNGILVEGKIDRSEVARIVFHDAKLLKALEEIIHPATYEEIDRTYRKQQENKNIPTLFVAEIPLLFETHAENSYDKTVAVVAELEICVKRFIEKTGKDKREFEKRMSQQITPKEKAERADYVIMNNGTLANLEGITKELYLEVVS
jgi:dephospho-CoA kinase